MAHLRVVPAKRAWLEALAESDEAFTALTGRPGGAGLDGGVPRHRALLPPAPRRRRRSGVEHPPLLRHRPRRRAGRQRRLEGRARRRRGRARLRGGAGLPEPGDRQRCGGRAARPGERAPGSTPSSPTRCASRPPSTRVLERSGFRHVGDEHEDGVPVWRWERPVRADDPVQMHVDEVDTDAELVRRLLRAQHPQWADLPITRVPSAGTDNAMYRLGDDLVGAAAAHRLGGGQRGQGAAVAARRSRRTCRWPCRCRWPKGEPTEEFPYPWGVAQWLPGRMATARRARRSGAGGPRPRRRSCGRSARSTRPTARGTTGARRSAAATGWCATASPGSTARWTSTRCSRCGTEAVGGARARRTAHLVPRRPLLPERARHRRAGVRRSSTGAPAASATPPST